MIDLTITKDTMQNLPKFTGTVQTLTCYRDGAVRWTKQLYIKDTERDVCYAQYNGKMHGEFLYDLTGMQGVIRKPRNIPDWKE